MAEPKPLVEVVYDAIVDGWPTVTHDGARQAQAAAERVVSALVIERALVRSVLAEP